MGLLDSLERVLTAAVPAGLQIYQARQNERSLEVQRDIARLQAETGRRVPARAPAGYRNGYAGYPRPPLQLGGTGAPFQRASYQRANLEFPGGAPVADIPFVDVMPQGASQLMSPYKPTMAGARAQAFVAINPMSGSMTWFKPAGRPILWSGDLATAKRVKRIASRARRSSR